MVRLCLGVIAIYFNYYRKLLAKPVISKESIEIIFLRHIWTILDTLIVGIEKVSRVLGYSTIRTTYNIYVHLISSTARRQSERFEQPIKHRDSDINHPILVSSISELIYI